MKTRRILKGLALGVMFTLSTAMFAGEGEGNAPSTKVSILPYLQTDYSIVSVNNFGEKNAVLTIENEDGEVFHKEWINQSGFTQKVLDFSYLNDGKYTIVLRQRGKESFSKSFLVEDHKVVTRKSNVSEKNNLTSFINVIDNTLFVSHLEFTNNEFSVSIINNDSQEVFTKTYMGKSSFSKKFDISALPTGSYMVQINSDNKDYTHAFNK